MRARLFTIVWLVTFLTAAVPALAVNQTVTALPSDRFDPATVSVSQGDSVTWTNAGGFYGSWADNTLDCEYTYYGLLALGHLSL